MPYLRPFRGEWGKETTIMEPTITQNSALYLVQQKISARRSTRFDWIRNAASKQPTARRRNLGGTRIHRDNGR
jgi:hypothetical protein